MREKNQKNPPKPMETETRTHGKYLLHRIKVFIQETFFSLFFSYQQFKMSEESSSLVQILAVMALAMVLLWILIKMAAILDDKLNPIFRIPSQYLPTSKSSCKDDSASSIKEDVLVGDKEDFKFITSEPNLVSPTQDEGQPIGNPTFTFNGSPPAPMLSITVDPSRFVNYPKDLRPRHRFPIVKATRKLSKKKKIRKFLRNYCCCCFEGILYDNFDG